MKGYYCEQIPFEFIKRTSPFPGMEYIDIYDEKSGDNDKKVKVTIIVEEIDDN